MGDPIRVRRVELTTPDGVIRGLVATLDLSSPRLELVTTEPLSAERTGGDPRVEARLTSVDEWMRETGCVFATNANYFGRLEEDDTLLAKARGWQPGERVDVLGFSISNGRVVSPARVWNGRGDPSVLIGPDMVARFGYFTDEDAASMKLDGPIGELDRTGNGSASRVQQEAGKPAKAMFAVAGLGAAKDEPDLWTLLVERGENRGLTARSQPTKRHPRSAIGATRDGRTLILAAIDGRQPEHSVGITLPELADLMIAEGAWDAINLDGGGSTSMIIALPSGGFITNKPSDGRFRPVGNHLGARIRR